MAVLGAMALVLAPGGSPDAFARDRCGARGAKTVVASGSSRVFSVPSRRGRTYYGCVKGKPPVSLAVDYSAADEEETSTTNTLFRVSGSVVAWFATLETESGVGEVEQAIVVRPLARGARRLDVELPGPIVALAVRGDGALAWILSDDDGYAEVDKVDSEAKRPTPLAYARTIDPSSLRVDEDSVDWRQAGARRIAPLR